MNEEQAWREAQQKHSVWAYSEFIRNFPNSAYAPAAKDKLIILGNENALTISKAIDPISKRQIFEVSNQRGEIVPIPYKIIDSSEKLYLAQNNSDLYGFLDKNLNIIIPFEYQEATIFIDGLAKVSKNGDQFFIDKHNQPTVPQNFYETDIIIEETPEAKIPEKTIPSYESNTQKEQKTRVNIPIPPKPEPIIPENSTTPTGKSWNILTIGLSLLVIIILGVGIFWAYKNNWWMDSNDIPITYNIDKEIIPFRKDDKWGYANKAMQMVVEFKYDFTYPFKEGRGMVKKGDLFGFINEKSELIIPITYEDAYSFSEGIALVQENELWGAVDREGNRVINFTFVDVDTEGFSEGLLAVQNKDEKWGFIDKNGKLVINYQFDNFYAFSEGLAAVQQNNKWGFIDKNGKFIVKPQYDDASYFSEGVAPVRNQTTWLTINTKGEVQEFFEDMEELHSFSEALAPAKKDGKWGFVDKKNVVMIDFEFDYIDFEGFREGLAAVQKGEKWGFIDKTGREIIAFEFESTDNFKKNEVALVKLNGIFGYIDKRGIKYFE